MKRRQWDSKTKAKIVLDGLAGRSVSEICSEYEIDKVVTVASHPDNQVSMFFRLFLRPAQGFGIHDIALFAYREPGGYGNID